jgi:pSer/pThr/pTyr-binding forkhead associated (FHA) protein
VSDLLLSKIDGTVLQQRRLDPARGYWIGRESTCDFIIDHPNVSRRHALVFHINGRWMIADAGSPNGLDTESGPVRFTQVSSDAFVNIGSVYIWLTKAIGAPPEWNDAEPSTDAWGNKRVVRLAVEDFETVDVSGLTASPLLSPMEALQRGSDSSLGGSHGVSTGGSMMGSAIGSNAQQVLVVTDRHGGVHLCADLSRLGALSGSGAPRLSVGRSTATDLQIAHRSIDPLHCVLVRGRDRWSVVDAGSSQGLIHDGKRWFRKRLEHGITIPIGDFRISVQDVRVPSSTPLMRPTVQASSGTSGSPHGAASAGTQPPPPHRPSVFLHPEDQDDTNA